MESELMDKNESKFVLNRLLVQLYGDILKIEEKILMDLIQELNIIVNKI